MKGFESLLDDAGMRHTLLVLQQENHKGGLTSFLDLVFQQRFLCLLFTEDSGLRNSILQKSLSVREI